MKYVLPPLPRYSPPHQTRTRRPSEWGFGMSVGITAIAENGAYLVVAHDLMASLFGGTFSADATMDKGGNLVPRRWGAVFAGDDITQIGPVIRATRDQLDGNSRPTQEQVAQALKNNYQAGRQALAVDRHLGIYGLTMDEFLSNGLTMFGDVGFGVIRERIDHTSLDCSLLVGGFDHKDYARLFSVEEPGVVHDFNSVGYWAIGSGATNALGRLSIRRQSARTMLAETIYNVCEAKVAAENALGVGTTTTLLVVSADGIARVLSEEVMSELRGLCQRSIKADLPGSVELMVMSGLREQPFHLVDDPE